MTGATVDPKATTATTPTSWRVVDTRTGKTVGRAWASMTRAHDDADRRGADHGASVFAVQREG